MNTQFFEAKFFTRLRTVVLRTTLSTGRHVEKIRIGYFSQVEIYSPVEPYEFTSIKYDLSMKRRFSNGTVIKYSNYLRYFRINEKVS